MRVRVKYSPFFSGTAFTTSSAVLATRASFEMKRIVAVKLRNRQIKHVLVEMPCAPLALRLKLFNTGAQGLAVENAAATTVPSLIFWTDRTHHTPLR